MGSLSSDCGFPASSIVVATQEQVSCDMDGDAVILNLSDGVYYELNAVGARIWNLIQKPRRLDEVRDVILEEYEVERDQCECDIQGLFYEMAAKGLIEIKDETAL